MSLLRSRRLRSARRLGARGTVLLDPLAPPRLGADTLFCLVASHYLEYYGRVPPSLAYAHPEIVSFSTPSMRIRYGPKAARKEFTYEFSPPMHAGEARKRLEEMHAQAKVKLGIVRRPSPSLRLAPASGRLTLAHVQSDAVVSGLPLSVPAIVGTLGLTYLAFLLATARPERVASWVPWQARAFAPLVKLAGLDPDAPANAGRAIQAFWLGTLYLSHLVEVFACLEPYFRQYNVESAPLRFAWVRRTSPLPPHSSPGAKASLSTSPSQLPVPNSPSLAQRTDSPDRPLQRVLTFFGGFPVWQSLRDAGKREEKKLKSL